MTLNEDLVLRVRRPSTNLSETVERLLADFVEAPRRRPWSANGKSRLMPPRTRPSWRNMVRWRMNSAHSDAGPTRCSSQSRQEQSRHPVCRGRSIEPVQSGRAPRYSAAGRRRRVWIARQRRWASLCDRWPDGRPGCASDHERRTGCTWSVCRVDDRRGRSGHEGPGYSLGRACC
jgi:hypothetical protein